MGAFPQQWDEIISGLPGASILQTREWARIKDATGWAGAAPVVAGFQRKAYAAALVLRRRIRLGGFAAKLCVMYVPRGPILDWDDAILRARVLADLQTWCAGPGRYLLKSTQICV